LPLVTRPNFRIQAKSLVFFHFVNKGDTTVFKNLNQKRYAGKLEGLTGARGYLNGAGSRGGGARLKSSTANTGGPILLSALLSCAAVLAQGPPHQIIAFPQRDFVSASGYTNGDKVVVQVIHPGGKTLSSEPKIAGLDGLVEVNHPGGVCWVGETPDIRPGDTVQTLVNDTFDQATVVANVTARLPVQTGPDTIQIHGAAKAADGVTQIPIDQIEERLVANKDLFLKSGKRTLRATSTGGPNGILAYDSQGSTNWTATYTGLQPADVTRALGAESRILWLGGTPAAGTELTIYENGAGIAGGPAAPCTTPAEPTTSPVLTPFPPTLQSANQVPSGSNIMLTLPTPASDKIVSYGVYRNGVDAGSVDVTGPLTFTDSGIRTPGTYAYTIDATDAAGDRSAMSEPARVTVLPPETAVTYNAPSPAKPHQIIAFPARDFISASGYGLGDQVNVYVYRPNSSGTSNLIGYALGQIPQDDPTTPGLVEVNHPGGGCWVNVTPRMQPGDIIRTVTYSANGSVVSDETTVADIAAGRPINSGGIITVQGTAKTATSGQIDLAQVEERLVARNSSFLINGKRTLRAASPAIDGTFAYTSGTSWTATYTGLQPADVSQAQISESRILWLGRDPLAATELTIFENGDAVAPGPAAPCTGTSGTLPLDTPPQDAGTSNLTAPVPATAPAPPPPNAGGQITGLSAEFRQDQMRWKVSGTDSVAGDTVTITYVDGPRKGQSVITNLQPVPVAAGGVFTLDARGLNSDNPFSFSSSAPKYQVKVTSTKSPSVSAVVTPRYR
jgi:hypothetical protein